MAPVLLPGCAADQCEVPELVELFVRVEHDIGVHMMHRLLPRQLLAEQRVGGVFGHRAHGQSRIFGRIDQAVVEQQVLFSGRNGSGVNRFLRSSWWWIHAHSDIVNKQRIAGSGVDFRGFNENI